MHGALCLLLVVSNARPPRPPPPSAPERTGIQFSRGHILKLELGAGVVADSNPTNTPLLDYPKLARGDAVTRGGSPGVGALLAPALTWRLDRKKFSLGLRAAGRAWAAGYLAPGAPALLGQEPPLQPPRDLWPQMLLTLDGGVEGTGAWMPQKTMRLSSALRLSRSTVPTAEQLGTLQGRTSLAWTQGWTQTNRRQTWSVSLEGGVRGDLLDDANLDFRTWQLPARDRPLPFYLGGVGVFGSGAVQRSFRSGHSVFARGQVATAMFLDRTRMMSLSVPAQGTLGWAWQARQGTVFRLEAGLWFPNALCPNLALQDCSAPPTRKAAPTLVRDPLAQPDVGGWAPRPVGLAQWDQALGRRHSLMLRVSKVARPTLLYSYVDEKRVDAAITGMPFSMLQLRAGTAFSVLSYGAPVDPASTRTAWPLLRTTWPRTQWFGPPKLLRAMGRMDGLWSADASLRWIVTPWLVLALQQSVVLLLTNLEVPTGEHDDWTNPSMVRTMTTAVMLVQW